MLGKRLYHAVDLRSERRVPNRIYRTFGIMLQTFERNKIFILYPPFGRRVFGPHKEKRNKFKSGFLNKPNVLVIVGKIEFSPALGFKAIPMHINLHRRKTVFFNCFEYFFYVWIFKRNAAGYNFSTHKNTA